MIKASLEKKKKKLQETQSQRFLSLKVQWELSLLARIVLTLKFHLLHSTQVLITFSNRIA